MTTLDFQSAAEYVAPEYVAPEYVTPKYVVPDPEPMIVTPAELLAPPGRRFWTEGIEWDLDKSELPFPWFTVAEVAKTFFGRKSDWLRWRSEGDEHHPEGWVWLDGVKVEPLRTLAGARRYTLFDIEKIAYALAEHRCIDGDRLSTVISLVKYCAKVNGYLV